jgi:secreted PhoX family phosphatase
MPVMIALKSFRSSGRALREDTMLELSRRHLLGGATAATAATAFTPLAQLPARAAMPLAGKQTQSFYRYKVRDLEITAVTDGTRGFR